MGKQLPEVLERMVPVLPEAPALLTDDFELWLQVLAQAVRDAENNINSSEMRWEKRHAKAWLCGGGGDFNLVATLCGFDPGWAKEQFRRHFEGRPGDD